MVAERRTRPTAPTTSASRGSSGWKDPPILGDPSETETIHGREYEIFVDGDRVELIAWHRGDNTYWIANDLLQTLTNDQMLGMARSARGDHPEREAEDRKGDAMSGEREPIGVIGVGWVGLVTAACFAELGHPVIARDILAEKVEALSRGEVTIHEPGLDELLAPQRRAAHLHHRHGASCSTRRGCSSSASTRRRPTPATPTSRGSAPWSRSCAATASTCWS